jgi:hypothetical protein
MDQNTAGELLCHCLSMETDGIRTGKLEQLSASDWDSVIQLSARHGVAASLYQRLKTLGPDTNIPPSVMQSLRKIHRRNGLRNIRLYDELSKVLGILQTDGIPAIALKGAHLAEVVYGNIALRPMRDVDLLVRKADLSRVEEKLLEMGYTPHEENAQHMKDHFHCGYVKDVLYIEIHWNIQRPTSPFRPDIDGLWERAQPAKVAGVEVLVLSPEDLLLHLCLHHSSLHSVQMWFSHGLWFLWDIYTVVQHWQKRMRWEQVLRRAQQWDAGKPAYFMLYLARELLAAPVPDDVLNALEPNDLDSELVIWFKEQILSQGAVPLAHQLARIRKAKRLRDKVTVFLETILPSPKAMAAMYSVSPSSKRIYLYYPVRLKDLFVCYGRAVWQRVGEGEVIALAGQEYNRTIALIDWLAST